MKQPKEITACHLEVIVMPNGEIICAGKSLGHMKPFAKYLTPLKAEKADGSR